MLLTTCGEPGEKPFNKFADPVIVRIADLKDRRAADSLYPYFHHEQARYRREAVEAFASLQDAGDVDKIGRLLMMDPDTDVRRAAAFALGQIEHPSCERLLLGALMREKVAENTRVILEAYGKVTARWNLAPETFLDDTLKSTGLAWSLYRAGIRGKTDATASEVAARLLDPSFPQSTRLGAAHYFARTPLDFAGAEEALITTSTQDDSPEIRMATALALGRVVTDTCLQVLRSIVTSDADPRVAVNAVRALGRFPFARTQRILYQSLRHPDISVAITASEIIRDNVTSDCWTDVAAEADRAEHWQIKANLLEGAIRAGRHKDLVAEVQRHYENEDDPYIRASLLAALKHYPAAFTFVATALNRADTAVIRSAAAATLTGMNYSEAFDRSYKNRFAQLYAEILRSTTDPTVIGTIASALADSTLQYRGVFRQPDLLEAAQNKLQLPRHAEALQPVGLALAYLRGDPAPEMSIPYNHPIDWDFVRTIPEDLQVTVRTTRGNMIVRLYVNEAPGSVANFLMLARQGYYKDKLFHRVVPNFVIQTGCNRGDGWGSEDYSIRSEFSPLRYATGSVGMASAGKDTEGTQWFVTHSPTPHLEGRYTLFGEVVEGMKVVEYIEVGDRITGVDVSGLEN